MHTLNDKYKVGREFHNRIKPIYRENTNMLVNSRNGHVLPKHIFPKRVKIRSVIYFIILILFIAALKNPSQSECEKQIKLFLVESVKDIYENMSESESDDSCKGFERLLISALAPSFIDAIAHIQTTDYILFSTFKATAEKSGRPINLVSGIMLFGKIIPLSTDINKNI